MKKLKGIETEYGSYVHSRNPYKKVPEILQDSRAICLLGSLCNNAGLDPFWIKEQERIWNHGLWLPNEARLYIDLGHPEFSTAEFVNTVDLVAQDKAGEMILNEYRKAFDAKFGPNFFIKIRKANSDRKGHSWGCHENYQISRQLFENLVYGKKREVLEFFTAYQVVRQIFCGGGKIGSEASSGNQGKLCFQVSQRADFIESWFSSSTTTLRPIINLRDEPLASSEKFGRLHVVCGEANRSEWSTFLKISITALVLEALEHGFLKSNLVIKDPVKSFKEVSYNPYGLKKIELENGSNLRPVEILEEIIEVILKYRSHLRSHGVVLEDYYQKAISEMTENILPNLKQEPLALAGRIDYLTKLQFFNEILEKFNLSWKSSPNTIVDTGNGKQELEAFLKNLDLRYLDIDPSRSIYDYLDGLGHINHLVEASRA